MRAPTFAERIQALFGYTFYYAIRLLPIDVASSLGGWIGRTFGPLVGATKTARCNLTAAFPEKTPAEIEALIKPIWDNLMRTAFEFPHMATLDIDGDRVELVGAEHIEALKAGDKSGIFMPVHLANWEVVPLISRHFDLPVHIFYRAPNNPLMVKLYTKRLTGGGELLPKGAKGARRGLQLLKQGAHLGMLPDQKMNDGIPVPFFGRDAMTAPALAQFALKFDCVVLPTRVERLGGAKFRVTCYPPMAHPDSGDRKADVLAMMTEVNAMLEGWIRERPEQWLWVHNRWPKN